MGAFLVEIRKFVSAGSGPRDFLIPAEKASGFEVENPHAEMGEYERVPSGGTYLERADGADGIDRRFSETRAFRHLRVMGIEVSIKIEFHGLGIEYEEPFGLSDRANLRFSFPFEHLVAREPVSRWVGCRTDEPEAVPRTFETVYGRRSEELDVFEREKIMAGNVRVSGGRHFEMRRSRKARGVFRRFLRIEVVREKTAGKDFEPVFLFGESEEIRTFLVFQDGTVIFFERFRQYGKGHPLFEIGEK